MKFIVNNANGRRATVSRGFPVFHSRLDPKTVVLVRLMEDAVDPSATTVGSRSKVRLLGWITQWGREKSSGSC